MLGAIALVALVLMLLGGTPGTLRPHRIPTAYENRLLYFAEHLGATELCEAISWAAYRQYSVMFAGGGASYFRSDCYERVAELRHDPSICLKVWPQLDLSPVSPGYSARSCRRRVASNERSTTAISDADFVETFKRMGYDIDNLPTQVFYPPPIRLRDVWLQLGQSPEAISRARTLVVDSARTSATKNAASPKPSDTDYLADLVAHTTGDAHDCERISPAALIDDGRHRLRDWCILTVATNQQDSRLCELLPSPDTEPTVRSNIAHGMRPEIARQLSIRGSCEQQTRQDRPGAAQPIRYGATLPPSDARIRELLARLEIPFPSARAWPLSEQAAYLRQVIFALAPGPGRDDDARQSARSELVRRLLALPR